MARLRREDVVAAARDSLARGGGPQLNLRALARSLGVTRQAVYHHFPRRDQLVLAMMEEAAHHLESAIAQHGAVADPGERLRLMVRTHFIAMCEESHVFRMVQVERPSMSEDLLEGLLEREARYRHGFVTSYRDAARVGLVKAMDADLAVHLILGGAESVARWFDSAHGDEPEAVGNLAEQLLLSGFESVPSGHCHRPNATTASLTTPRSSPGL